MKRVHYYFFITIMITSFYCTSDNTTTNSNPDCGKDETTICTAHNWNEFISVDGIKQNDGVYSHLYQNSNGKTALAYQVSLQNVCLKANISIDFTIVLNHPVAAQFRGEFVLNGLTTSIPMDNINGIITGHYNYSLQGFTLTSIDVNSLIVYSNSSSSMDSDIQWFNDNIGSFGIQVKFQNPK